jgi:phage tail sheath protein FI
LATAAQVDAKLAGGTESTFTPAQAYSVYIGSRALRQGIYALESVDIFNMLCLPGIPDSATLRSGILADATVYCQERRAFHIIDAASTDDLPTEMASAIVGTSLPKSDNAAVYYPWIKIPDPLNGSQPRTSAPCGAVAGIYARTDGSRGVWKAPAGTEATLTGVTSLTYTLTDPENGSLNPLGANCLRAFPVYGNVVWGARTLKGNDQFSSEYKYVPVRRLAYYMEESLYRGLKWAVFEPNDEPLWAQIRLNVGAFMHNLFRQGAFQGQKRDDAYFVKCDKETTTQNDINLGIVNIWVGFAPLKPAEFVVLYIQQIAGQVQV